MWLCVLWDGLLPYCINAPPRVGLMACPCFASPLADQPQPTKIPLAKVRYGIINEVWWLGSTGHQSPIPSHLHFPHFYLHWNLSFKKSECVSLLIPLLGFSTSYIAAPKVII